MASLRSKVETALVSALSGLGADVYPGIASDDKVLPLITVRAVSAVSDFHNGQGLANGNFVVTVELTVRDRAATDSTFDDICLAVRGVVQTDEFPASLTSAGFTVFGVAGLDRVEWGTDGEAWTETRTMEIACCES